jgi:two-component system response regulator
MNAQFDPIRTLVADDSEEELQLLRAEVCSLSSVKLIGFVHDGLEAIDYLRGVKQFKDRELFPYPDLLLLDFNMPRCGGMEVLEFLRPQLRRPRVILWSNTLEQVNIRLAFRLGADLVCPKPASISELAQILEELETKAFNIFPVRPALPLAPELACANA